MGKKRDNSVVITLEELEAALGGIYPECSRPDGFLSSKEWSREWGTSLRTAQMRLADAIDAGMVEMRKYRRRSIDGGTYSAAHYRISPDRAEAEKSDPAP